MRCLAFVGLVVAVLVVRGVTFRDDDRAPAWASDRTPTHPFVPVAEREPGGSPRQPPAATATTTSGPV